MVGLRRTENERKSGRRDGKRRILLNLARKKGLLNGGRNGGRKKDFSWPRETLGAAACTTAGGGGLHVHYRYQTTNTVANLVKFLPCEEMNGNLVQRAESQTDTKIKH